MLDAIKEHQDLLENLCSALNKDDTIGTSFWFELYGEIEGKLGPVTTTLQIADNWSIDAVMETFVETNMRFLSRLPVDRVAVGDMRVGTVTVSNFTGTDSDLIADLDGSPQFSLLASQVTVNASTERSVTVLFRPTGSGRSESTLTIRRAADGQRLFRTEITGTTHDGPPQ